MRTKRTNGSTTYSYIYNGSSLSQMTVGSNTLSFAYDASGTPMSVTYNGTNYYYVTNLQGDVTAILNSSGTSVVTYTYDAWGNILSTSGSMASSLGTHNPLRYRGYVYDTESELYYLQSRYYDPAIGRFINADALVSTGQGILGNNMFAYCNNNPIAQCDPTGRFGIFSLIGAAVGAAVGAIVSTVDCLISSGGEASATDLLMAAGAGAVSGALSSFGGVWLGAASVFTGLYAAATTDGPIEQKIFAGMVAGGLTYIAGGKAYAWGNVLLETQGMTYGVYALGTAFVNFVTGMSADLVSLGAQKAYDYYIDSRSTTTTQTCPTINQQSANGSSYSGMHRIDNRYAICMA